MQKTGSSQRKQRGLSTGTVPRVGAVAVFPPNEQGAGPHGHVAYVEAVNGDEVVVSEANFYGHPPGHRRTVFAGRLELHLRPSYGAYFAAAV